MGYVSYTPTTSATGEEPAAIKKGVFSLFFRIPQESLQKAADSYAPSHFSGAEVGPIPQRAFNGVIPLFTFGPQGKAHALTSGTDHSTSIGSTTEYRYTVSSLTGEASLEDGFPRTTTVHPGQTWGSDGEISTNPSMIGIDCRLGADRARLFINLETGQYGSIAGVGQTQNTGYSESGPNITVDNQGAYVGDPAQPDHDETITMVDKSFETFGPTAAITNIANYWDLGESIFGPDGEGGLYYFDMDAGIIVRADVWHHVLISFDISNGDHGVFNPAGYINTFNINAGVTSAAHLWTAFNDVNYTEKDLSIYWPTGSSDPNAVISSGAYRAATFGQNPSDDFPENTNPSTSPRRLVNSPGQYGTVSHDVTGWQSTHYTLPAIGVAIKDIPLGLPADDRFVDNIYHVEMAEFRFFTDVTLETAEVSNRRAFVTKDGKPNMKYKDAEDLLGKKADYAFTNSSAHWKNGEDQGVNKLAFDHVGDIKTYHPNPKIGV